MSLVCTPRGFLVSRHHYIAKQPRNYPFPIFCHPPAHEHRTVCLDKRLPPRAMPPFRDLRPRASSSSIHSLSLRPPIPSSFHFAPQLPSFSKPTRTNEPLQHLTRSLTSLLRRQVDPSVIPTTYSGLNAGPTPGTVVGIVFGSVAGFLLVLWLIYSIFNTRGFSRDISSLEEEVVVRRRSRSPRRSSPRRSSPRRPPSSRSRSETIEVSRNRSPRRETRRETVILEETRRAPQREDDIVEVIEEHSPVRRVRRESRRESGYRTVDPEAYGGGDRPLRKVRR